MAITKTEREEALRLEALKIAANIFSPKGANEQKLLAFAAQVYEFIKGDPEPEEEE